MTSSTSLSAVIGQDAWTPGSPSRGATISCGSRTQVASALSSAEAKLHAVHTRIEIHTEFVKRQEHVKTDWSIKESKTHRADASFDFGNHLRIITIRARKSCTHLLQTTFQQRHCNVTCAVLGCMSNMKQTVSPAATANCACTLLTGAQTNRAAADTSTWVFQHYLV